MLNRDFLLNDGEPETYTAHASASGSFSAQRQRARMPGCHRLVQLGVGSSYRHFRDRHPRDHVNVEGSGVFPKCQLCNMQIEPWWAARHENERSKFCREGKERIVQTNAAIANRGLSK